VNLYLVVSEVLTYGATYDREGGPIEGPGEYCIVDLVVARSRAQATYLAWQADPDSRSLVYDIRDKPKFRTRLKIRGVDGPARIASNEHGDYIGEGIPNDLWLLESEEEGG
jgi:hypothetical protein